MSARRNYEIVFDGFNKRWTFKPQGLPGALQIAKTREEVIQLALPICNNQPCTLRIYDEAGKLEEERAIGR